MSLELFESFGLVCQSENVPLFDPLFFMMQLYLSTFSFAELLFIWFDDNISFFVFLFTATPRRRSLLRVEATGIHQVLPQMDVFRRSHEKEKDGRSKVPNHSVERRRFIDEDLSASPKKGLGDQRKLFRVHEHVDYEARSRRPPISRCASIESSLTNKHGFPLLILRFASFVIVLLFYCLLFLSFSLSFFSFYIFQNGARIMRERLLRETEAMRRLRVLDARKRDELKSVAFDCWKEFHEFVKKGKCVDKDMSLRFLSFPSFAGKNANVPLCFAVCFFYVEYSGRG